MIDYPVPVLGVCAYSGTGKTTLLTRLLPVLGLHQLTVGVIKHAHHRFDVDHPGKDSYELRRAGAAQMLVASRNRMALMTEFREPRPEPILREALKALDPSLLDLVLVEGFKHEAFPKMELHRPSLGRPLICTRDPNVVAVVSDAPLALPPRLPCLDLNRPEEVAEFIIEHIFGDHDGQRKPRQRAEYTHPGLRDTPELLRR